VVSTGVNGSAIMAYLKSKGLYRGKLVIVFSDYHIQRFWLHHEADLFICNIPEQIEELKRLGFFEIPAVLTGTLIAQKFFQPMSREQARESLGLLQSMPLVLIGGAGKTRNSMQEIFQQLLRSPKSFQIAVLCGTNNELKEELSKISAPTHHPVKILGFVDNMELWMSAGNVFVYKTGGPTMAEAVVKKLPIVFVDVRAGHELINLQYLLSHGIGAHARIPREAQFFVEEILDKHLNFDFAQALTAIVSPPGVTSLVTAIDSINPQLTSLKVKHYQN
jgi:processive 1,2-diacylglycerol beta-glucosyltransferase